MMLPLVYRSLPDGWLGRLKARLINHPQSLVGEIGLDKKRNYGVKQKKFSIIKSI